MIDGVYYQYIYLFFVTIATISVYNKYRYSRNGTIVTDKAQSALLLAILCTVFIGLRPNSPAFRDSVGYVEGYYAMENMPFAFTWDTENYFFDNIYSFFASYALGWKIWFLFLATIYFIGAYHACHRLFPNNTLAAYVTFLGAFSTFSYGTNGIKAGAAASLFLLAISYQNKKSICALLLFSSLGMHHSMPLPIIAFVMALFFKKPKWYFCGWILSVLLAIGHVSFFQNIFAGFTDEKGAKYLGAGGFSDYAFLTGFRPDFMLYSAMPVWVGYIAKFKKNIKSKIYDTLLYTYITTNAVWMLCMYASFTNRIAYLSWCLYPIVLIYPFLNENWGANRYRVFAKVMIYHLLFTIFMELIYYGGIAKLLGF